MLAPQQGCSHRPPAPVQLTRRRSAKGRCRGPTKTKAPAGRAESRGGTGPKQAAACGVGAQRECVSSAAVAASRCGSGSALACLARQFHWPLAPGPFDYLTRRRTAACCQRRSCRLQARASEGRVRAVWAASDPHHAATQPVALKAKAEGSPPKLKAICAASRTNQ